MKNINLKRTAEALDQYDAVDVQIESANDRYELISLFDQLDDKRRDVETAFTLDTLECNSPGSCRGAVFGDIGKGHWVRKFVKQWRNEV